MAAERSGRSSFDEDAPAFGQSESRRLLALFRALDEHSAARAGSVSPLDNPTHHTPSGVYGVPSARALRTSSGSPYSSSTHSELRSLDLSAMSVREQLSVNLLNVLGRQGSIFQRLIDVCAALLTLSSSVQSPILAAEAAAGRTLFRISSTNSVGSGSSAGSGSGNDVLRVIRRFEHLRRTVVNVEAEATTFSPIAERAGSARSGISSATATDVPNVLVSLLTRVVSLLAVLRSFATEVAHRPAVPSPAIAQVQHQLDAAIVRVSTFLHRVVVRMCTEAILSMNVAFRVLGAAVAHAAALHAAHVEVETAAAAQAAAAAGATRFQAAGSSQGQAANVAAQEQLSYFANQLTAAAAPPEWKADSSVTSCSQCDV
ncbi:MAG: hypothetical protein EOO41_04785, partial [Methanobacteriota archaeon]